MVFVKGGAYFMGGKTYYPSHKPEPIHPVHVSSFYISKYLVTQKEWEKLMGMTLSRKMSFKVASKQPIFCISWLDAIEYCNTLSFKEGLDRVYRIETTAKLPVEYDDFYCIKHNVTADWNANGYRLPTEAEWEFAARGGNKSKGGDYSGSIVFDEVGWCSSESEERNHKRGKIQPVGYKKPNELGLYDMSGLIWEWCWDVFDIYPDHPVADPRGPENGIKRVMRGGTVNHPEEWCTVFFRWPAIMYDSGMPAGLRLCRSHL